MIYARGASSRHGASVVPRAALRRCTLILVVNLVLSTLLLFVPYFQYKTLGAQTYANTHVTGLDPRDWFPFSMGGLGLFLYDLWLWVWLTMLVVIPLLAAQIYLIYRHWHYLSVSERFLYISSTTIAAVPYWLIIVVGHDMIPWLID